MKTCMKCERTMPLECFSKNSRMMSGYLNTCKDCVAEQVRQRRARVIPIHEYLRKWRRTDNVY